MARGNGKPDPTELDTEHELPPGDDDAARTAFLPERSHRFFEEQSSTN